MSDERKPMFDLITGAIQELKPVIDRLMSIDHVGCDECKATALAAAFTILGKGMTCALDFDHKGKLEWVLKDITYKLEMETNDEAPQDSVH